SGDPEEEGLASGVLKALPAFLKEVGRAALAFDADEQGVQILDARSEFLRTRREDAVRRALKKEERRPRLEQRVGGEQLRVPLLERAEMLFLFLRKFLEDGPSARVLRKRRGAIVKVEPAALGRDRDAERVAGEHQLGRGAIDVRDARRACRAGPAFFAGANDLNHRLARLEIAGRRNLFHQGL